jgi:hypothetical protein
MYEFVEQEDVQRENVPRNWKVELEVNHPLVDDLMSRGLLEYEDCVDDLEAKSPSSVQRGRLLDLVVKPSPRDRPSDWPIPEILEALQSTGQEHVANFITRNGCKCITVQIKGIICQWQIKGKL